MTKKLLPCPFCGRSVDLKDADTLYPNGTAWQFNNKLQTRFYHPIKGFLKRRWCWAMHCPETSGGCGAEISGDSRNEAITKWNKRIGDEK